MMRRAAGTASDRAEDGAPLAAARSGDRGRGPAVDVPAAANHEIDDLLTPIQVQVELLLSGRLGPLSPKQQRSAEILAHSVRQLRKMVRAQV